MPKQTFRLDVISLKGIVFEGEVESVYLHGTEGEFELLPFHYPILASLGESEIQIAGHAALPIRLGVVMFRDNACTIIVEMIKGFTKMQKEWG